MPLEDANFISELNPAWPLGTDSINQGDDHDRVTKKAVVQSFGNIDKAVTASADDLNTITDAATTGVLVPTGAILPYAAASPPNGYLLCDGAAIDPQFSDLIALIGLNTPDLRGQFLRGWSSDTAQDPDAPRAPLSSQDGEVGPHRHGTDVQSVNEGNWDGANSRGGNQVAGRAQTTENSGAETRPKNVAVAFIIKT